MVTGSGIFSCFPVDAVLYQTVGDEIYPAKEGKDELRRGTGEGCAGHRACRQSQGTGKAMYNGMEWTARSEKEEVTFEPEDSAEVTGIEGVKLILRKKEEV